MYGVVCLTFEVTDKKDLIMFYVLTLPLSHKIKTFLLKKKKRKRKSGSLLQRKSLSPPNRGGLIYTVCRVQIAVQESVRVSQGHN